MKHQQALQDLLLSGQEQNIQLVFTLLDNNPSLKRPPLIDQVIKFHDTLLNQDFLFRGTKLTGEAAIVAKVLSLKTYRYKKHSLKWFPLLAILPKLKTLNLSNKQLSEIPTTIGDLQQLQQLDLSKNNLHQLPSELANCQQLRHLLLENNNLSALPNGLEHLQELSLGHPDLEALPRGLAQLKQLQTLYLNSTAISCENWEELAALKQLEYVTIHHTYWKEFPIFLSSFHRLKRLCL